MNFKRFVVLFSILGIFILYGISVLSQPVDVQIDRIGNYEGMYVRARGTVTDLQVLKYGSASMKLRNNTSYAKVFVESYEGNVSAGDEVEVSGRVEQYKGDYEIVALNERAIKILKKWDEEILFVSQLAQNPEEYIDTNVKLVGKVGKVYARSFNIGDESGTLSLKVVANNTSAIKKGDPVTISGRFIYDPKKAQYYLDSGVWNKTFEFKEEEFLSVQQLAQSPREYRNSSVTVTGYVTKIPDEVDAFYLKDEAEEYSIKTKSNNTSELVEWSKIIISCPFLYDSIEMEYYLEMRNRTTDYDRGVTVSVQQLVRHPLRFQDRFVNVMGEVDEVKKEVFHIKDRTGDYSIRVSTNNTSGLFEGNTIKVTGAFVYDPKKLEYNLSLESWRISNISIDGNVSLEQLALDPERYEGTNVTLVGYVKIDKRTKNFFYLNEAGNKTGRYSLRVKGNTVGLHEGDKIKIDGTFVFDSENLRYQLEMRSFEVSGI